MGRGRPTGSKETAAATAAKAAKKRTAHAEAASQGAAKRAAFFAPRTRSSANSAAASSAVSSRSSTTTASSSVLGMDDSEPPVLPLSIAGAGGAGAGLAEDTSVPPPLPPSGLGNLASAVAGGGAGAAPTAVAGGAVAALVKLGIEEPSERFYYYSVYVWLPDVRWGAMPSCPCGCNRENVISHGFRTDTIGRRVTGVDTHYYVIGKRYKCTACEKAAMAEKAASAAASKTYVPGKPHTFMGYDASVLPLYEYSVGDRFPAYLTYNLGVSKEVIRVQGSVGGRHVLPLEQGRQNLKIIDQQKLMILVFY